MSRSFAYRVVDARGRRTRGLGDAETSDGLTHTLESQGFLVLDVVPVAKSDGSRATSRHVRRQDLLEVTRALAALLGAGLALSRALTTAAHIVPERVGTLLEDIRTRTARGDSLAAALEGHAAEFPAMYCGVIRAGERSGDLAGAFTTLAAQMEAEDRLRARLLSASIYPMLLAVGGVITCSILVLVVLPRFAELFAGTNATMPRTTAALLATAAALRSGWPLLLVIAATLLFAVLANRRSARVRRGIAALVVRLPVLGLLRRYTLAARFARLTGVLLEGGAPLLLALDDVLASIADPLAREEVARIRDRVHDGTALHRAVAEGALFPGVLGRLVAVGEESGRLREFLTRSADFCEDRAERILARLVALAEPTMILLFGIFVGFVALSLLQALYGIDAGAFR